MLVLQDHDLENVTVTREYARTAALFFTFVQFVIVPRQFNSANVVTTLMAPPASSFPVFFAGHGISFDWDSNRRCPFVAS